MGCVYKSFSDGKPIIIHQTEKANGENAQVSYIAELDEWVVGSKNCSYLVKDYGCIENVKNSRYDLVVLIAKCWLDIVSKMDETTV